MWQINRLTRHCHQSMTGRWHHPSSKLNGARSGRATRCWRPPIHPAVGALTGPGLSRSDHQRRRVGGAPSGGELPPERGVWGLKLTRSWWATCPPRNALTCTDAPTAVPATNSYLEIGTHHLNAPKQSGNLSRAEYSSASHTTNHRPHQGAASDHPKC